MQVHTKLNKLPYDIKETLIYIKVFIYFQLMTLYIHKIIVKLT